MKTKIKHHLSKENAPLTIALTLSILTLIEIILTS